MFWINSEMILKDTNDLKMTKWLNIRIYNFRHRYYHESRKYKDARSLNSEDFGLNSLRR